MKALLGFSVLAVVAHVILARLLSQVDLVSELVVHHSLAHACLAAALIGVRLFLVFALPGALLALLVGRRL